MARYEEKSWNHRQQTANHMKSPAVVYEAPLEVRAGSPLSMPLESGGSWVCRDGEEVGGRQRVGFVAAEAAGPFKWDRAGTQSSD